MVMFLLGAYIVHPKSAAIDGNVADNVLSSCTSLLPYVLHDTEKIDPAYFAHRLLARAPSWPIVSSCSSHVPSCARAMHLRRVVLPSLKPAWMYIIGMRGNAILARAHAILGVNEWIVAASAGWVLRPGVLS